MGKSVKGFGSERYIVVDRLKFAYEGIFDPAELYNAMVMWFRQARYEWFEPYNQEEVTEQGKQIYIVMSPIKSASEYYRLNVKIQLNMLNLREIEVERDGQKVTLHHGVVRILIDAWVADNRKKSWKSTPVSWFVRFMMTQYFFRDYLGKFKDTLGDDIEQVHHLIKDYLNVYKYTYQR